MNNLFNRKFCFCDNNFGRYNKYADERCNCPCAGDQNKNCGCKLKNTVWELRGLAKYEKPVCSKIQIYYNFNLNK